MHDATLASLSKIEVGQTILVTANVQPRGFGRPKDPTAIPLRVTAKDYVPDSWSGKVWTLTLNDDSKTEGRYGTTHVYVVEPAAATVEDHPKLGKVKVTHVPGQGDLLEPIETTVETQSGDKRVVFGSDGVVRVKGWKGGDVVETTPHGKRVHIAEDGVITVIEDDGTERPAVITPEPDEPTAADLAVLNSDRCGQCKGYGVVRKRGDHAGQAYKTANGADAATANGNSVMCPVCKGEALVSRSA